MENEGRAVSCWEGKLGYWRREQEKG